MNPKLRVKIKFVTFFIVIKVEKFTEILCFCLQFFLQSAKYFYFFLLT